jgi:hypothetical protein
MGYKKQETWVQIPHDATHSYMTFIFITLDFVSWFSYDEMVFVRCFSS